MLPEFAPESAGVTAVMTAAETTGVTAVVVLDIFTAAAGDSGENDGAGDAGKDTFTRLYYTTFPF